MILMELEKQAQGPFVSPFALNFALRPQDQSVGDNNEGVCHTVSVCLRSAKGSHKIVLTLVETKAQEKKKKKKSLVETWKTTTTNMGIKKKKNTPLKEKGVEVGLRLALFRLYHQVGSVGRRKLYNR